MKLFQAKEKIKARKAEVRTRLKKLRVDMADDTSVDPDEVAEIMRDAGIDFEELERQVETLKRRRAMVAQIEECRAQNAKAAEIDDEIQEAEAAFSGVLQNHRNHVASLKQQQSELGGRHQMPHVEAQLHKTATDPDLREAKEELASVRLPLTRRQRGLKHQLNGHRDMIERLNSEIARQRSLGATPSAGLAEDVELREGKAKELSSEIEQVQQEINELNAQIEELKIRELDPNSF